uniref:Dermaseptin-A3 n=1 Tax=Agalychnis annae TaxID=75990 RepID=DRS3_AGAAN|nr:RecName: Full=Dermaseptin-A3; Short=DRS-A3; AltName: Full=Dermaseptin AA-3-1; Flags: Precursor [Agalychnis annae]CAA06422.1 dermaseptin-related peptide [Agalychnis annae]
MAFLKKSLFLVLLLGLISLSICEEEKRENEVEEEQEDDEQSELRRSLWSKIKEMAATAGKAALNAVTGMVNQGEQ